MIIKLLPNQVPRFWEAIKYAFRQTGYATDAQFPARMNELLHELLSNKAQCWIMLDDKRTLTAMMVTLLQHDKYAGRKYLHIELIYAWTQTVDSAWLGLAGIVRDFAIQEKCGYATFYAISGGSQSRVVQLAKMVGWRESGTNYKYDF